MNISAILQAIDGQIGLLQQARELINASASVSNGSTPKRRRGRPPGTGRLVQPVRKRTMSEAGRARIVAAQKKRWAESRKVSKAS